MHWYTERISKHMKVSVIIPCYYSEKMIAKVVDLTRSQLVDLGYEYQFVLVNDGSTDGTFAEISKLADADPNVLGIDLSRNFGQNNALVTAMHYVTGDVVIGMDDDLQTHPTQIPKLLGGLDDDTDLVYGVFPARTYANIIRKLGSKFEHWSLRVMTGHPKGMGVSSFWAARRYVCEQAALYEGPNPFVAALMIRTTTRIGNVPVEHFKRAVGESGYTFKKLVKTYTNLLGFSVLPIRAVFYLGCALSAVSILAAIAIAITRLFSPHMFAGWSSLIVTELFSTGVIVFCLGIVGEYLGRVFTQLGRKPQFIVRRFAGTPEKTDND